jgi:hypothetical protein
MFKKKHVFWGAWWRYTLAYYPMEHVPLDCWKVQRHDMVSIPRLNRTWHLHNS